MSNVSTVNAKEMQIFTNLSENWWDKNGQLKGLHFVNSLRVQWIIETIAKLKLNGKDNHSKSKPLEGLKILDVGCGAGLVTEALAEYGGVIVGLDPCQEVIHQAKKHLTLNPSLTNITYVNETIEEHCINNLESYDAVIAAEVVDHVDHVDLFLDLCCRCLKPGGPIFITTFNQTWASWLIGIILYEYILGVVPLGTHSWFKFITPENVSKILKKNNCETTMVQGFSYNFLTHAVRWCSYQGIHYALLAVKGKNTS